MSPWVWQMVLVGLFVLLAIALLSIPLNRRKAKAYVALRLAEMARCRGEWPVAVALYEHVLEIGQRPPEALDGLEMARGEDDTPLLPEGLVTAMEEVWADDPDAVRGQLAPTGYDGPWPSEA